MNDCQRFREALEALRHGATSQLDLEAHLETCEGCRAYEAEAVAMERALHHFAERVEATVATVDCDDFLRKGRWIRWRNNLFVAGWALVLAFVLYIGVTSAWIALVLSFPLFSHLKEAIDEARGERAAQELISSEEEWLEHFRKDLRGRYWRAFFDHGLGSWVQAALFLFFAVIGKYTVPCALVAATFFLFGTVQMIRAQWLRREYQALDAPAGAVQA